MVGRIKRTVSSKILVALKQLRVYPYRVKADAKGKAKATSLGWTALICPGIPTPSESEREIASLIAYGPIGAIAKAILLSLSLPLGVGMP